MRIILKEDVPSLGRAGEEKNVRSGYARNYLLPRGLVMIANARSKKELVFLESVKKRKQHKRRILAEELRTSLEGFQTRILMNVGTSGKLFGSVTNLHICNSLKKNGFNIDRKQIIVDTPIRELGIFSIEVRLYDGVTCSIKLLIEADTSVSKDEKSERKILRNLYEFTAHPPKDVISSENSIPDDVISSENSIPDDVISPKNTTEDDVISPKNTTEDDVVSPKNTTEDDVVSLENTTEDDVISLENTTEDDVVSLENTIEDDVISLENTTEDDVISPKNTTEDDVVSTEKL